MKEETKLNESTGYWRGVWTEYKRDKMSVLAVFLIFSLFLVAVFDDLLAGNKPIIMKYQNNIYLPALFNHKELIGMDFSDQDEIKDISSFVIFPPVKYSATENDLFSVLTPPDKNHYFGTDDRGRDVLSRMIHGTKISLSIGFVAVGIAFIIGITLGGIAGYYGGRTDFIISRLFEIMITFPVFFLILTILAFRDPSIYNIMIVLGATGWTGIARLIRGDFLKIRNYDYITAQRALGANDIRIMFVHILPNALAPVLVAATFGIAGAILTESALSFLGFGVPPPTPSWGDVLSQSKKYIDFAWWLVIFPGLAIFLTVTSFNLVGEGFRNALDPKLRGR